MEFGSIVKLVRPIGERHAHIESIIIEIAGEWKDEPQEEKLLKLAGVEQEEGLTIYAEEGDRVFTVSTQIHSKS